MRDDSMDMVAICMANSGRKATGQDNSLHRCVVQFSHIPLEENRLSPCRTAIS